MFILCMRDIIKSEVYIYIFFFNSKIGIFDENLCCLGGTAWEVLSKPNEGSLVELKILTN